MSQSSHSISMLLRHSLSITALPFMVAVVVPIWLARRGHIQIELASSAAGLLVQLASFPLFAVGLALFVSSLWRFASEGRGTLAPWDPPRAFVASGPYRYVRNPMISGVIITLLAEACALRSLSHFYWACAFTAVNALYLPLVEEPQLERRFGETYRAYCRAVPRILPRLRPWDGSKPS